jgi:hypothetical protein
MDKDIDPLCIPQREGSSDASFRKLCQNVILIKQHLFCNWLISEVGHLGFHVQVSTVSFPVVTDLCEYG